MFRALRNAINSPGIWLLLAALLSVACDRFDQKPAELSGSALGTTYSIKIVGATSDRILSALHTDIKSTISDIDKSMSVFYADSEISLFNSAPTTDWVKVSPELFQVVKAAVGISESSAGAFDVTIGNLIELWGFGKTIKPDRIPATGEILRALQTSHYQNFQISAASSAIRKTIPDLTLNLSAIAKGYAVDVVSSLLERRGIEQYLVEIGGEVKTKGFKQNNKPWLIAVESPEIDKRSIYKILNLSNNSMATSGDYRNFYEIEGKRYSHTIDPETGWPVVNNIASVSVIHPSCMIADALATTLMAMGYEKGSAFAENENYAVLWILRTKEGTIEKVSSAFNTELFQ